MAQLNLHPCTAKISWSGDRPRAGSDWETVLRQFLKLLADNCVTGGASLIGHIKGIATVAGEPCLQFNLVSADQPVDIAGSAPDGIRDLQLVLNLLVFGISANDISAALYAGRDEILESWQGSIEVDILAAKTNYPVELHG